VVPGIDLRVPGLAELHRRRSQKWANHPDDVLAATVAELDFPLAPPVAAALRAAVDRHDLGYATPAPARLRELLAAFAARRLGWQIDPEQVTVVPDVMAGLIELSRALVAPDESVTFATPAYPPFFDELAAAAPARAVPLRADGSFDLDGLSAALRTGTRALVLVNPHNPTGRVLPREELTAVAELCAEHGAWVLADEIHAPLVLPGARHTPWLEVSEEARACGIVLTSGRRRSTSRA